MFNENYQSKSGYHVESSYMAKVFMWMSIGLMTTGIISYYFSLMVVANPGLQTIAIIAIFLELAVVWALSSRIMSMSKEFAMSMFVLYSFLNGLSMSYIFIIYSNALIFHAFLLTSATFGTMAAYGYYTKADLSKYGPMLMMAVLGLFIASIANMIMSLFFNTTGISLVMSYITVLIFVALTAYDMQEIKKIGSSVEGTNKEDVAAIIGALKLYIDFIVLFQHILRILASKRD